MACSSLRRGSSLIAGCLFALLQICTLAEAKPLARITVSAGKHPFTDCPVSVLLQDIGNLPEAIRLEELADGRRVAVPLQREPGSPQQIWWILSGKTPAGATRTFQLTAGAAAQTGGVKVRRGEATLEIRLGGKPVLRYNSATVTPPKPIDPAYARGGYIHPVWTPQGSVVTDHFSPDHPHQNGVWLAWTKTRFQGRDTNFWDIQGARGQVRFAGLQSTFEGPVFAGFRVRHELVDLTVSKPRVALHETWDVRVWNVGGSQPTYRLWDLTSTQRCLADSAVSFPKYHYGGFAIRGHRQWTPDNCRMFTSAGHDRKQGNFTKPHWVDMSGLVAGRWAGIATLGHPGNFRFPQAVRLHPTMPYFCLNPSQDGPWSIEPNQQYVSRYRLYVHDGQLQPPSVHQAWANLQDPPVVALTRASSP